MYKEKKIAVIIPARKGSKGVPDKNITLLDGIPLIEHTLVQVKKVSIVDKIIVSTDSEEICDIAKKYIRGNISLRPAKLSTDTAVLYDVLKYEIHNHSLVEKGFDIIVLLQPTSPLRRGYMIQGALIKFIENEQESAVGVSEVEEHPIFMRTINNDNRLVKLLNVDSTVRRQDLLKYYKVNGMIYINKIHDVLNDYVSFNDNLSPIIIPNDYAIDIDSLKDFEKAEKKLKIINYNKNKEIYFTGR